MSANDRLHICVIAGEASGDRLGFDLINSFKEVNQDTDKIVFSGIGGEQMGEAGLRSLFPMTDLSVMGVAEILPRLPLLLGRIDETFAHIRETRPDIIVTIDSPDFVFRVMKRVKRIPDYRPKAFHYVAPTVWAWRPKRAKKLARLYDGIMCLYPFEPPYFAREGMRAVFVGHPVISDVRPQAGSAKETPDTKRLGVYFGSRKGELKRMGALYADVIRALHRKADILVIAPTLPHLADDVRALLQESGASFEIITDAKARKAVMPTLDLALATSGTVGLELAVAKVPHIIAYRVNRLTYEIVRRLVRVRYAHLVNIMQDEGVVTEFIQDDCKADALIAGLSNLIHDQEARNKQLVTFTAIRERLTGDGEGSPAAQAAAFILSEKRV